VKYIRKGGAPPDYIAWCNQVRGTLTEDYRCLQKPEKAILQEALMEEQGWLCAYTLRRIDENHSHIEHIKPESICRSEQTCSDLDYDNLIACFPHDGMPGKCRYGAQQKGNWWDNDGEKFVSPLHANCEKRFRYDLDGNIKAFKNHPAALTTIKVLKLNHPSLAEDRMRVIQEFIYGPAGDDPLSNAKVSRAMKNVCNRMASGYFYEFCVAIRDALTEYGKQLERIKNRRRFRRRV
jgi:uncharacterized protein (TIGR02646 family)